MNDKDDVIDGIAEILRIGCIRLINQKIENNSNKQLDFKEIVSTNTQELNNS